jgi:hypothetical protein
MQEEIDILIEKVANGLSSINEQKELIKLLSSEYQSKVEKQEDPFAYSYAMVYPEKK